LAFSFDKGSSKTPQKRFCKKCTSKTFYKKIDKNFHVRFSSTFLFYRVYGCFSVLSDGSYKHHKKVLQKRRVKKILQKIDKKPQTIFSSIYLSSFWAFLGERSSKTPPKSIPKNLTPVLSWPLTTHGGPRKSFTGPLQPKRSAAGLCTARDALGTGNRYSAECDTACVY
jgi:hypothetical protein